MSEPKKKRFFLSHKKSSALVVSVAIHAFFIIIAITFVAVTVYVKPEQIFVTENVKRPKMNLRKLQVPVKEDKRTQAPKLRHNIVAKPKLKDVAIKMPEVIGVPGGTYGAGQGLGGLGFGFDMDLFGSSRGTGNEFIGTFYDLKQGPDGTLTDIGEAAAKDSFARGNQLLACKIIKGFVGSGFNEGRMKDYFKAPKLKYNTVFMMPTMDANAAPTAFGVQDQVKPSYWLCHYKGQMAAPETGRYRFCGLGDDVLVVRVARKVVLDACWPELIGQMTSWDARDENNRRFPLDNRGLGGGVNFNDIYAQIDKAGGYNGSVVWGAAIRNLRMNGEPYSAGYFELSSRMVIGDWISLKKGQVVDVDILIGEIPGGKFMARLLVEQEGKEYKMVQCDAGKRPVLPAFKTTPVDEKLIPQMGIDPNEITLDGPVFGVQINAPKKMGDIGY